MTCNPSRLELSNAASTTVQITLATDPGDGTTVTLEVDGLGLAESGTTSSGVVSFTVSAVSASNNSIWDATIQVGANRPATAEVLVVETNTAQTIGVTIDDADVTYCGALGGGGTAGTLEGPIIFTAKNRSGGTLTKGQAVYISGHAGDRTEVMLADADVSAKMPAFGLVNSVSSADNSDVELVTFGEVRSMDTLAFAVGATVYIGTTPGALTTTKPTGSASLIQNMGRVVRSHETEGIINVMGAGRTNDVPNLADGEVFYGVSGSSVATDLTTLVPDNAVDSPAVASTPALAAGSIDAVVALTTTQYGSITPDSETLYVITDGTTSISDSDDVTITGVADHDFLVYDSATSDWINRTPANARADLGLGTLATQSTITDSYVGHVETIADGTYYIDTRIAQARTLVSLYLAADSGATATIDLQEGGVTMLSGTVSLVGGTPQDITTGSTPSISDTSLAQDTVLTLVISGSSSGDNLRFAVEYTQ